MRFIKAFSTSTAFALVIASPAFSHEAEEGTRKASADLIVEWHNDYRTHSDDTNTNKTNNSYTHTEMSPTIPLGEKFYIDGTLTFEPMDQVNDVNAPGSIFFDRNGLFAEELKLNFEDGPYHLWLGKFNPEFGRAWDWGRGLWTKEFNEDYHITEKLGMGASYTFGSETLGEHTISATTFTADRSFLSRALVSSRGPTLLADGGASNRTDLGSYTLSATGENIGGIKNLSYIAGLRYLGEQTKNQSSTTSAEKGYNLGLQYVWPVSDNFTVDTLTEFSSLKNFAGTKDDDRKYYSLSFVNHIYQNWLLTVGGTYRRTDDGTTKNKDHLLELSGGYDFGNGITAEAGLLDTRETQVDTNTAGILVRYQHKF